MISILVAGVALLFLLTIIRGFLFGLFVAAVVNAANIALAVTAVVDAQQQTRTSCYDSFTARICETFDAMGNIFSKSRRYQSGRDILCDTQSFNGTPATPLIPNGDRLQRCTPGTP